MTEQQEKLALVIDRLENIVFSLNLNLPSDLHVKAIKEALPEIHKHLKEGFIEVTGENPWQD